MKILKRIVLNNSARKLIIPLIENGEIELLEEYTYPEGSAIWVLINHERKLDKKITIKEPEKVRNQRKAIERKDLYTKHKSKIRMNKKINQTLTMENEITKSGEYEHEKELYRIILDKKGQELILPMIDCGLIQLLQEFNNYPEGKVYWILLNKKTIHRNPFLKGIKEKDYRRKNRIAKEKKKLFEKFPNEEPEEINRRFNIRGDLEIKYLSKDNLGILSYLECNENNKKLIGKITNKNGIEKPFVCNNFNFYGLDTFEIYKEKLSSSNTQKVLFDVLNVGVLGGEITNIRVYSEFGISSEDNGKIGFKDSNNNWAVEPKFDLCTLEERKYFGYYIYNSSNTSKVRFKNKDGLINKDGQYLVPPIFDRILNIENTPEIPFSKEINFIYEKSFVYVMKDGLFGIYDIRRQDVVVPVIFNKIINNCGHSKFYVYVMSDGLIGIYDITKYQQVVLPPMFNEILTKDDLPEIPFNKETSFIYKESYVFGIKDQLLGIYDLKKQKFIIEPVYKDISYNKLYHYTYVFKCYKEHTFDLLNENLEKVINDIDDVSYHSGWFEYERQEQEHFRFFYIVSKTGKYGVLECDTQDLLIPFEYQYINELNSFSNERTTLFVAKHNNLYGVINHRNEILLNFEYEKIIGASGEMLKEIQYKVVKNGATLLVDSEGKKIISLDKFDKEIINYLIFSEGLAAVRIDGTWGYINSHEECIIEPKFLWGGHFKNGQAEVMVKTSFCDRAVGVIDNNGHFIEGPTCNCPIPDSKGRWYL